MLQCILHRVTEVTSDDVDQPLLMEVIEVCRVISVYICYYVLKLVINKKTMLLFCVLNINTMLWFMVMTIVL